MGFVEALEMRRLLSGSGMEVHGGHGAHHKPAPLAMPKNAVKVSGRNLMIQGTAGNDVITVTMNAADPAKMDVTFNGVTKTVAVGKLKRIMVNGKRGDDTITIDASVKMRAHLEGGAGKDVMKGGSGDDFMKGGPGEDQMTGGLGADHFVAQTANEVLDLDATQNDKMDLPPPAPPPPPATV